MHRRLVVLSVLSSLPAQSADPGATPGPAGAIDAAVPRIAVLLRDGIGTVDPSANIWRRAEQRSVFDGSYDWHSCIAAHWAALSLGRVTGDGELVRVVLERLSPATLAAERALLADPDAGGERVRRARATFTPYADAWLVLLLAELARHPGRDDELLRSFRAETEERVLAALESTPFPERTPAAERGGKPFCGFYRSWLFGYLMLRVAGPSTPAVGERLDALWRDVLAPQRAELAAYEDRHAFDFLHVRAVFALVERIDPNVAEPVPFAAPDVFDALPESVTLRTVHPVGVAVSELWPLAFDAARDPAARRSFEARTAEILARTDLWADDFQVVSHWVPQFLWFGMWLARGRP